MDNICIIGLGKLGTHLFYCLKMSKKFKVLYTINNSKRKIIPDKLNKCGIVFICTADSDISKVVNKLKNKLFKLDEKYIFHTSGAFNSDSLKPLESKGAYTGSFHPVQTFESKLISNNIRFNNIYIAVEGKANSIRKAKEITKALNAKPIILTKEEKLLHHINSVISSNYLIGFLYQIEKISQLISSIYRNKKRKLNGFKKTNFFNIYKPLIEQTLKNIEVKGTIDSLTGPIARNDIKTIQAHIKKIKEKIPELLPFYSFMGMETVKLALKKKSIKIQDANKLLIELNKYSNYKRKRK